MEVDDDRELDPGLGGGHLDLGHPGVVGLLAPGLHNRDLEGASSRAGVGEVGHGDAGASWVETVKGRRGDGGEVRAHWKGGGQPVRGGGGALE